MYLIGCDRKHDFIGGRVYDACDKTWPVCNRVAGCLLGTQSYIEGRLPGQAEFIVQLAEPSAVNVHVFVEDVKGTGQNTAVTFYETGCVDRTRQDVTGQAFIDETQQFGEFVRGADLSGTGDHLVSFESDAQAHYTLKVDVIAKRSQ